MPVSDVKLKGRHNLQNVLAAVSISMCYHVPIDLIRMTVRNFKGIEHRLEFVTRRDGVTFYNDSKATNIDSAIKSLEAMDKPVILIAGGYDKNLGFTEWVKLFNKKVKYLILIGQTSNKIISECDKHGFSRYKKASSMDEAVEFADLQSDKGDIILLSPACASYDMFKNYEERGKSFKSSIFSKL